MVDLSILTKSKPEHIVDAWIESSRIERDHLGLSEIGHPCKRYLWYVHHKYNRAPIPGRVLRLFRTGDHVEFDVVTDFISAGYEIYDRQKELSFTYDDAVLRGHIDGIIRGLIESSKPHLLEVKSSNDARFKKLLKVGYEEWDAKYKAQVHVYMLGMKLERALVVVENKNDSERYTERIRLKKSYAVKVLEDAFKSISSEVAPERMCPRVDWYEAKFCSFYKTCWK